MVDKEVLECSLQYSVLHCLFSGNISSGISVKKEVGEESWFSHHGDDFNS